uniref:Uncharacterized protein n=1 Tax=Mycolicibacterium gilvum (strain PYR-GCK) TaxID=350054 RepID=A4TCZ1_MYCGI|nr:hypothetical protein Mflv_3850 [Mycolicibacterium gilvum PYR-GCK]
MRVQRRCVGLMCQTSGIVAPVSPLDHRHRRGRHRFGGALHLRRNVDAVAMIASPSRGAAAEVNSGDHPAHRTGGERRHRPAARGPLPHQPCEV